MGAPEGQPAPSGNPEPNGLGGCGFFPFGDVEVGHLRASEPRMAAFIDECEARGFRPQRPINTDAFAVLCRCINDQLISLKAAASIWTRIVDLVGEVTPQAFAAVTPEQIHACGTTIKKAEYMHGIALRCLDGSLDLEALRQAPDQEVMAALMGLRGIGQWTAEVLLIHCFLRPDVIPYGDAAIRRGLCMLHGIDAADLTRPRFDQLTAPYHPYATTASIYLWCLSKQ